MTVEDGIKKYGLSVYITESLWTSEVYKAFIQPLRYKNKMYMSGDFTEIGHYREGYYLYLGPAKHDLSALKDNAELHTADGKSYFIHRAEKVYLDEKALYVWAVIKEKVQAV